MTSAMSECPASAPTNVESAIAAPVHNIAAARVR